MIGIYSIFDSHQICNICEKSCLEMASVGIETLLKAIFERTDRLARSILPVPRGLTAVAWCVVVLPHNWRWNERHHWRVAVLQNATVSAAVDVARIFGKERPQELWRCLPTETR